MPDIPKSEPGAVTPNPGDENFFRLQPGSGNPVKEFFTRLLAEATLLMLPIGVSWLAPRLALNSANLTYTDPDHRALGMGMLFYVPIRLALLPKALSFRGKVAICLGLNFALFAFDYVRFLFMLGA